MNPRFPKYFAIAVLVVAIGSASSRLAAATIGTNYPASGQYSPVSPSSWGSANWPLGATFTNGPGSTLEIGVYSANATKMVLEIYLSDTGAAAAYDYDMVKGPDNIWRAAISGAPNLTLYAFRAWGPNWPYSSSWARGNSSAGFIADFDSSGNRFNPNKVLFDPYTRELSHNTYTAAMAAAGENYSIYTSGGANISSSQTYKGPLSPNQAIDCRDVDDGVWAPKSVALVDTTPTGTKPNLSQKDAIIYETHLKGLTAHPSSVNLTTLLSPYAGFQDAANVPNNLRGTYAGAAYMAGYLKDLGFNTVEFLPIHETDNATDSTSAPTSSGGGYWGYYTYGYFAPDRRYASNQALGGPTAEFKAMVAAFHNAGIEVYLDVVYNHSGEGGVWDSSTAAQAELTFLRGLDNQSYYTLVSGSPQYYWVSTGVGTNVNAGSAPVQNLVLDSLSYWVNTMGVDGFRFDEAAELGRNGSSNFSSTSPMLVAIAQLAATHNFKIIAEPWDVNDGGEIGNFPAGWACWNGNYRDSIRMYMTGNVTGYVSGAADLGYADAFFGDQAKMAAEGGPQKSVNMIVCHDGFNMTDLVSYGTPPASTAADLQWPFGPEQDGGSDNSSSWGGNQSLRRQAIRDFWTYQVLSRGLPMMIWGDEFGRTVNGNNNSYNIDSVATWNNYNMLATNSPDTVPTGDTTGGKVPYDNNLGTFAGSLNGNFIFLQNLLHLRAQHVAFRQQDFTSESITFANPDGSGGFSQTTTSAFQAYVHGTQVGDDDFLVLTNVGTSSATFTLPTPPTGTSWVKIIDTNNASEATNNFWSVSSGSVVSGQASVGNQSIVVLEAAPPTPTPTPTPAGQTARLINISVRSSAGSGAQTLIGGFVVGGSGTKDVLVRGDGPVLASFGVTGVLTDPVLTLYNSSSVALASNAAWGGGATLSNAFSQVGAFPLPSGSNDAALLSTVSPGAYTGNISSTSGDSGVALVEIYDADAGTPTARFINLSARSEAGTGSQTLIAGFVINGTGNETVLIRGDGPVLTSFGLSGVLEQPQLTLYDSTGAKIATNTGWNNPSAIGSSAVPATVSMATSEDFAHVGAFAFPTGSADSAFLVTLPPGAYTAQVTGFNGTTGVALVEVYEVQ
jgi:glycogen operon protein